MSHPKSQKKLRDVMEEYINLPRVIKAAKINHDLARMIVDGEVKLPEDVRVYQCARIGNDIKDFVLEFTLHASKGGSGKVYASFGDWIALGVFDEWYPVGNEVFLYKYTKHMLMDVEAIEGNPYQNG